MECVSGSTALLLLLSFKGSSILTKENHLSLDVPGDAGGAVPVAALQGVLLHAQVQALVMESRVSRCLHGTIISWRLQAPGPRLRPSKLLPLSTNQSSMIPFHIIIEPKKNHPNS